MTANRMSPETLARLMLLAKKQKSQEKVLGEAVGHTCTKINAQDVTKQSDLVSGTDRYGNPITFNLEQSEFIHQVLLGSSAVLIGAAGTGKTSCMNGAVTSLIQSGTIPIIQDNDSHKYLAQGTYGIVACSFTRRAVSNLRKAMPQDMRSNCITIHKLLEYAPVEFYVIDPVTGEEKKSMRFEPQRNSYNPLPSSIKCVIIDESSMVSTELFSQLTSALPHNPQFIFLGDIQQLPPVFGSAVLGYKMLEYPCIELIQVYRQALESPIIKYATLFKDGIGFQCDEKFVEETPKGKVTVHPWKKRLNGENACLTFCKFIQVALDSGSYDPENDCILIPFNKAFGTDEVNKSIANHIAHKAGRIVWEIVAGFNKLYLSVGDRVLFDKEDAIITSITHNGQYLGAKPAVESTTLDYWGYDSAVASSSTQPSHYSEQEVDFMLDQMAAFSGSSDDSRVRQASHLVTVVMQDSGEEVTIDSAAGLNSLLLSYALTVHKSQGSEWRKVFFILHQSHATMIQRELLYTGWTRAAEELYVICEPDTFMKGVKSQKIKGNTLAEKAEWFKGKLQDGSIPK